MYLLKFPAIKIDVDGIRVGSVKIDIFDDFVAREVNGTVGCQRASRQVTGIKQ